jgi:hypothetical protein
VDPVRHNREPARSRRARRNVSAFACLPGTAIPNRPGSDSSILSSIEHNVSYSPKDANVLFFRPHRDASAPNWAGTDGCCCKRQVWVKLRRSCAPQYAAAFPSAADNIAAPSSNPRMENGGRDPWKKEGSSGESTNWRSGGRARATRGVIDFESERVAGIDRNRWPTSFRNGWPTCAGISSHAHPSNFDVEAREKD